MREIKSKRFLVWQPSGQEEAHALEVDAATTEEAAEVWAGREWEPADGKEIALKVRDSEDVLHDVTVNVDDTPSFLGMVTK